MLELKSHKATTLLKEAVALMANISHDTKATMYYTQDELSFFIREASSGTPIAELHLLTSGFRSFYCDKPGFIAIDLSAFSTLLNLVTDNDTYTISFGDIRRVKTYRGDKVILFRFKHLGTSQTQIHRMMFEKANLADRRVWQYDDQAMGIPVKEFNQVFRELDLDINGETGADDSFDIHLSNGKLKFSTRYREIFLVKELGQYEVRGSETEQQLSQECSLKFASSHLKAVKMTDRVWLLRSSALHYMGALLKCEIEQLGYVIFNLCPYLQSLYK